ncbi:MAG: hypothetical protein PHI35_09720, partial [Victivallaceae bacterium]|nr:hypothetical protein [Victivallaceae bacterium]
MSVNQETPSVIRIADGETTGFTIGFTVNQPEYIAVSVKNPADHGFIARLPGTDFYVSSGFVKFIDPPVSGARVWIERNSPASQETCFANAGRLDAETLNAALDHLARLTQEDRARLARCVKVDPDGIYDFDELIRLITSAGNYAARASGSMAAASGSMV